MGFAKLHDSVFDSSVMEESESTRLCWFSLLILADRNGVIDMTPAALARRIHMDRDKVEAALEVLQAPDPQSRTPDCDGRRIIPLEGRPWGWQVVNFEEYRKRKDPEEERAAARERKRRQRERDRQRAEQDGHGESHPVTPGHDSHAGHDSAEAEADAQTEAEADAGGSGGTPGGGGEKAQGLHLVGAAARLGDLGLDDERIDALGDYAAELGVRLDRALILACEEWWEKRPGRKAKNPRWFVRLKRWIEREANGPPGGNGRGPSDPYAGLRGAEREAAIAGDRYEARCGNTSAAERLSRLGKLGAA